MRTLALCCACHLGGRGLKISVSEARLASSIVMGQPKLCIVRPCLKRGRERWVERKRGEEKGGGKENGRLRDRMKTLGSMVRCYN